MSSIQKYQEQIEQYVHGRMSPDERAEFEKVIQSNSDVRDEVESQARFIALYEAKPIYELNKVLSTLRESKEDKNISKSTFFLWSSLLAACIFGVVFMWSLENDKSSLDQLILTGLSEEGVMDPSIESLRKSSRSHLSRNEEMDVVDSLFLDLNNNFDQFSSGKKEFRGFNNYALELLSKSEFKSRYSDPTKILLSRSLMLEKKPQKALEVLSSIDILSGYHCYAEYYSTIAKSMVGDLNKIKFTFPECPEFSNAFAELKSFLENSDAD